MPDVKYGISIDQKEHEVLISPQGNNNYSVTVDGTAYPVSIRSLPLDNIADHVDSLESASYVYTGEEIKPKVLTDDTVAEGTDYKIVYSNNVDPGTAEASVVGMGKYSGAKTLNFKITNTEPDESVDSGKDEAHEDMTSGDSTEESKDNKSENEEIPAEDTTVKSEDETKVDKEVSAEEA